MVDPPNQQQPQYFVQTSYYLISSVLGRVITEMDENGHKRETSVYAGDALLAKQQVSNQVESVRFQHTNPITGSTVETKPDGTLAPDGTHEYDPQGNIVALSEPYQIASLRKQD